METATNVREHDQLLRMFCSTDDFREEMLNPFSWGGYDAATDGYAAIFIPDGEHYPLTTLDIARIFPEAGAAIDISVDEIRRQLQDVEMIDDTREEKRVCGECYGTGKTGCFECEQERPCPECDGEGNSFVDVPTGSKKPKPDHPHELYGVNFAHHVLTRLVAVADHFHVEEVRWVSRREELRAAEFQVGVARVILMPMRVNTTQGGGYV